MFRKKLATLIAAAMLTLSASSAFAAFTNGELLMVVHDFAQNTEIVKDTGIQASAFTSGSTFITSAANSGLYVTYFAIDTTAKSVWFTNSATFTMAARKDATLNAAGGVYQYFASLAATNGTVNADPKNGYSYSTQLDKGITSVGNIGGLINGAQSLNVNASLATLATGGTVNQTLWKVATYGSPVASVAGTITTSSTAPVANTPLPAAFYLMGSGLLGLVGLRRRNKA